MTATMEPAAAPAAAPATVAERLATMEAATAPPPAADEPALISLVALAKLLGVGTATIERHHAAGRLPAPRRLGTRLLWHRDEVLAWVDRPKPSGEMMTRAEWSPVWAALVKARRT